MDLDEAVDAAFDELYARIGPDTDVVPAVETDRVRLYDVQEYGEQPWDPLDARPDRDALEDRYAAFLDDVDLLTGTPDRDRYMDRFPEMMDHVFRDRVYSPTHSLHAELDAAVTTQDLDAVVDRLASYATARDTAVTVQGEPASVVADRGLMPAQYSELLYGTFARDVVDAPAPGEQLVLSARVAADGETAVAGSVQDDDTYLLLMERDDRPALYPVVFCNGVVHEDTVTDLARLVDGAASA